MAIHDINFCRPVANLLIAKTSSIVSDPVNGTTNPKAIPGATMRYCLLVTNGGSATATAIYVADPLPATTSFIPVSYTHLDVDKRQVYPLAAARVALEARQDDAAVRLEVQPARLLLDACEDLIDIDFAHPRQRQVAAIGLSLIHI